MATITDGTAYIEIIDGAVKMSIPVGIIEEIALDGEKVVILTGKKRYVLDYNNITSPVVSSADALYTALISYL